jgi:hypothetical protein
MFLQKRRDRYYLYLPFLIDVFNQFSFKFLWLLYTTTIFIIFIIYFY